MIKKIFMVAFLATVGIGTFGCTKTSTTTPAPAPVTGNASIAATIDGTAWTAASVSSSSFQSKVLTSGLSANGSNLSTAVPQSATIGAHTLSITSQDYVVTYTKDQNNSYVLTSGNITITSNSGGIIQGTFTGTGTNVSNNSAPSVNITNGTFTGKY